MASLKVIATTLLLATSVALLIGSIEFTIGNIRSGALTVVKLTVLLLASALPAISLAPVVTVAV